METADRNTVRLLFEQYRRNRNGIRNRTELASICLICGSVHIAQKPDSPRTLYCRDCGFAFQRYNCQECGSVIDGRDPKNPCCRECEWRICTCGACGCGVSEQRRVR